MDLWQEYWTDPDLEYAHWFCLGKLWLLPHEYLADEDAAEFHAVCSARRAEVK